MNFIATPWPNLRLYARDCGEIDPYDESSRPLFRGEEAFAPEVTGWERWSKPSPEPRLDDGFESVLLESIEHQAPVIAGLTRALAQKIIVANERAPVLIAVLRAGVPICGLLAPLLEEHYGEVVPVCAFSLFYGVGWDEAALEAIIADYPGRDLIFMDGWTSGGGVSKQLAASYAEWRRRGSPSFSLQFAVLCDPRGRATYSAVRTDVFVPSAAFTAPETLGFSRGFAFEDGSLFGVYTFPEIYRKPLWVSKWLDVLQSESAPFPPDDAPDLPNAPEGYRVHVNEVTRALINRDPLEIRLSDDEATARQSLAPLLYLADRRNVPVIFGQRDLKDWGTIAVARMK